MIADVLVAVDDWKRRSPEYRTYRDYYDGRHRQAFSSEAFEKLFKDVLENSRENLCPAAVKVFCNRLKITGWEGPGAEQAELVFDAVGGPRIANMTHREAHRSGDGFVLVWPGKDGKPRPWPHRAEQVVVMVDPEDPTEFAWVAKVWLRTDGYGRVNLYYPDVCERWITAKKVREASAQRDDNSLQTQAADSWPVKADGWTPYNGDDGGPLLEHSFGVSPWAWYPHDADTLGSYGRSVLHEVIPIQDALNKSVADLIVGGETFALPLRAILNYQAKQTIDPDTGKPKTEQLKYDIRKNRLIGIPGAGPLTQLDPPDATKLTKLHDAYALKIARVIGAPAYEFTQTSGDVPSGVSLRVLADRRTSAIEDFQQDATPSWTRLMSLLGVNGDVRPTWADPAPLDDTERLEIAEKKRDLGFPFRTVAKELGYDEDDLVDIEVDRDAEEAREQSAGAAAVRAFREGRDPAEVVR